MSVYKIIRLNENSSKFWKYAQELKNNLSYSSSIYSSSSLNYYRQRYLDLEYLIQDLSSIIVVDEKPFFAFLGACLTRDGKSTISAYEIPATFIEAPNISRSQKKYIENFLENLFKTYHCSARFRDSLLGKHVSSASDYILFNERFKKIKTCYARELDLLDDIDSLKLKIRKSFGSLINWGLRELSINVYDSCSMTWEVMDAFRLLHIREAGRETRSIATWQKQLLSILQGQAFCVTAHFENKLVSAGYFTLADRHCYYGVSASRRDLFDKPLFHALMWTAILYAKKSGAVIFETGSDYTLNCNDSFNPSEKERQIADFKAGFGGRLRPYLEIDLNF